MLTTRGGYGSNLDPRTGQYKEVLHKLPQSHVPREGST